MILSTELCLLKIHVLSAKLNGEENLSALCKSLIYGRKKKCPDFAKKGLD